MSLALDTSASAQVHAIACSKIEALKQFLTSPSDPELASNFQYALNLIDKFSRDPKQLDLPKLMEAPPGQPIGDEDDAWPFSQ